MIEFLLAFWTVLPLAGQMTWALPSPEMGKGTKIRRAFKIPKGYRTYTFFQLLFVLIPLLIVSSLCQEILYLLLTRALVPNYIVFCLFLIISTTLNCFVVVVLSAAFGNLVRLVYKGK